MITTDEKRKTRLNEFAQFTAVTDDLDIHFIHLRSKHPNSLPLIITHGRPRSMPEQAKSPNSWLIQPRTAGKQTIHSM
jgi:hypothetical protein